MTKAYRVITGMDGDVSSMSRLGASNKANEGSN